MTRRISRTSAAASIVALLVASFLVSSPAAAASGTISGTVTSETDGTATANVYVTAFSSDDFEVAHATTDSTGRYSLSLLPGAYRIQFLTNYQTNLVPEWSGDSLFKSGAAIITVGSGATATADAVLEWGRSISGSIMSPSGQGGYFEILPSAWDAAAGEWFPIGFGYSAATPTMTAYSVSGLSAKTDYRVHVGYTCAEFPCIPLAGSWYGGPTVDEAVDVPVDATDIDFTMSPVRRDRIAGADRFETSALIAQELDAATVDTVYLSSGLTFPDALSAAPAAAIAGAPLLLTAPDFLPAAVAESLEHLNPERVVITGREGSVSTAVEDAVAALLPSATIDRIGGADRFETSRLIIRDAFPTGADILWIATGNTFPDALSAAPVAGREGAPVLLVNGTAGTLDAQTAQFVAEFDPVHIRIAGGTPSVSAGIAASLYAIPGIGSVSRLSGADRYRTSVAVNQTGWPRDGAAFLATGVGFADALAGAALAGQVPGPIYIVPGTCVTQSVLGDMLTLQPSSFTVLGGPTSVSADAADLIPCT